MGNVRLKLIGSINYKRNFVLNTIGSSPFGVKGKIYQSFDDAKKDIFNYIEMFYNRKRRHASLGYVSAVVYEEMYEMKQNRAA